MSPSMQNQLTRATPSPDRVWSPSTPYIVHPFSFQPILVILHSNHNYNRGYSYFHPICPSCLSLRLHLRHNDHLGNASMASRGSASVLETIPLNHLTDTTPAPPLKKRKTYHSPSDWGNQSICIRVGTPIYTDSCPLVPYTQLTSFPHRY